MLEGLLARWPFRSRWWRLVGRTLLLGGSAYLLYTLFAGAGQLSAMDWQRYLWAGVAGLALYPFALISQALAWAVALHWLSRGEVGVDRRDLRIFASSHLARRLPGGVWHLVTRVAAYRDEGLGSRVPVLASVCEIF